MKKNRYQKAFAAFCRIRNTKLIAAREMFYAHCQIVAEEIAFEGKSLATRVYELFTVPRIRRASVAAAWIVISQQFSGINIMVRGLHRFCLLLHVTDRSPRPSTLQQSLLRPAIRRHSLYLRPSDLA
jgi:hypothetical protein